MAVLVRPSPRSALAQTTSTRGAARDFEVPKRMRIPELLRPRVA